MREVEIRFSSKEQNEKKKKETRIPCEKFQRRLSAVPRLPLEKNK